MTSIQKVLHVTQVVFVRWFESWITSQKAILLWIPTLPNIRVAWKHHPMFPALVLQIDHQHIGSSIVTLFNILPFHLYVYTYLYIYGIYVVLLL